MLSGLLVGVGIILQSGASVCAPTLRGSELVTSSEATLGATEPPLTFCLYGSVNERVVWLWALVAVESESGQTVAELPYPPELKQGLGLLERAAVRPAEFVDLDFDGYLDVTLRSFVGTGNAGSHVWRFDAGTATFRYQPLLSGRSLQVDPTRRELMSGWTGGHAGAIHAKTTFAWIDGEAVIVRDESQDWDAARGCYDRRVRERVDGELVETTRECSSPP